MAGYRGRGFPGTLNVAGTGGLKLGGTSVTSTAAELNLLDADNTEPADGPWAAVTRWAKAEYDFAVDGGVAGDISLGVKIPDNAIVVGGFIEGITSVTSSGSATVAVKLQSAADVAGATGKAALTGTAVVPCSAVLSAPFKLTAERTVTITVAVAALTAGKFNVWIEYFVGE
tara:strand:- start:697 stop:1212 length:516 start_codon:yes stop_codon:yes gene_type:complete